MTWDRYKPRGAEHGWAHAKNRKTWAAQHHDTDPCVRCGQPLGPMGRWLHLDHHDWDKTQYYGFSHAQCNMSAGGRRGNAVQHAARRQTRQATRQANVGSTTYRL